MWGLICLILSSTFVELFKKDYRTTRILSTKHAIRKASRARWLPPDHKEQEPWQPFAIGPSIMAISEKQGQKTFHVFITPMLLYSQSFGTLPVPMTVYCSWSFR